VIRTLIVALLAITLAGCSRQTESSQSERHYALSGRVIAVNARDQTATIDASAIPNFMEAMIMEYPIQSKADFVKLQAGDKITATVNVREDGLYDLSNIHNQGSAASK
jgi:Cu/Ag efflux protein CusF